MGWKPGYASAVMLRGKDKQHVGFDLVRKKTCFSFNYETWWDVIRLAVGCGWEPTGTGPPRGVLAKDWFGAYLSNDGQLVHARDAKRLADTIEKVTAVSSNSFHFFEPSRISRWLRTPEGKQALRGSQEFKKFTRMLGSSESGKNTKNARRIQPWILSRDGKSCLRDFIRFCRGGSFRIF